MNDKINDRIIILSISIIFGLVVAMQSVVAFSQEILPELKATVMIDDTVVTLGDLFSGDVENQELVISNAPDPGKKIFISARTILKFTRDHNVRWRNSSGVKNVSVGRLSTLITFSELKPKLVEELKNLYQSDGSIELRLYNNNGKIHLPNGYDVDDISITNVALDKKNNKFSATLSSPAGNGININHVINGRTLRVTLVPAFDRTIRRGEIIRTSDIKWISMPDHQIGRNIILSKDKLIGMTPRNQIKRDAPIRLSEVNAPILVKRGSLVKVHFNTNHINLTTLGKALNNGGIGDVVQIENTSSQKIISAIVRGPNQVQVNIPNNNLVFLNQ